MDSDMVLNHDYDLKGKEYLAIPIETDGQVAISDDTPSLFNDALLDYCILLWRTVIICLLVAMRIDWAFFEETNKHASENNIVFAIIGTVAFYSTLSVSSILWGINKKWLYVPRWDTISNVFKFIGTFSAFVAPFSIMMVLVLPPKFNWIGYLVLCVMFGLTGTCIYLDDQRQDKRASFYNNFVVRLVVWLMICGFIIPSNETWVITWILFPVIYVSLGLEIAYHFITCLVFINEKANKPSNLETCQHDKNRKHPRHNYLTILRI